MHNASIMDMANVTIRNLPEAVVRRIKRAARVRGVSMEQELRDLLETRYGAREKLLEDIRSRWTSVPSASAHDIDAWRKSDRRAMHS